MLKRSSVYSFLPGVILCTALLSAGMTSCKKNDLKTVEDITTKSVPAEYSTDVEAMYSDSSRVKARLTAPLMVRYLTRDPSIEMPKGLHVEFFDKNLKVISWIRADYGIRYINTALTKLTGNVQVRNLKGDSLNTEEMFWDERKGKVYGNKFVSVKTSTQVIYADGFESNIDFTKYTFHNIKGIINLPQSQ